MLLGQNRRVGRERLVIKRDRGVWKQICAMYFLAIEINSTSNMQRTAEGRTCFDEEAGLASNSRDGTLRIRSRRKRIWNTMQKPELFRTLLTAAIDKHAGRHTCKRRPTMKLVGAEEMR